MDTSIKLQNLKKKLQTFYLSSFKEGWYRELKDFLYSSNMYYINRYLQKRRKEVVIYPESKNIFTAFRETPLEEVRVVIIGMDPYYTKNHAHGLAFSSLHETVVPPSLKNIFKEIDDDIYGNRGEYKGDPDLSRWAKQGVLLLNTAFTVEQDKPGSHTIIWESFTKEVMKVLQQQTGIIYLLWGNHAKGFKRHINEETNYVLETSHPSPLAAYRGFFGCKHFSKVNDILEANNGKEFIINW